MPSEEAALKSDAKQTIEAIYKAHADRVLRYAQRRIGRDDAEEVVGQTFLTAWRRAQDIPEDPLPWLLGIARNVIRNMQRAGRRRMRLESRLAASEATPEYSIQLDTDVGQRIASAFGSLAEGDREILMLIAWDQLDHVSAAKVMGWSRANFRLRLHRARKRLRHRLNELEEPFRQPRLNQAAPTPEEAR